jgi:hypothetical protein
LKIPGHWSGIFLLQGFYYEDGSAVLRTAGLCFIGGYRLRLAISARADATGINAVGFDGLGHTAGTALAQV